MSKPSLNGFLTILLLAAFPLPVGGQAQPPQLSKKEAAWYKSQTWLNGLRAKPSETINQTEFARQYKANKAGRDKAFVFLRDTDFTRLRAGRYPIDDENVFATISEDLPRDLSVGKWEAHQQYSDIHFVVKGKGNIGIMPVLNATVNQAYDIPKDIGFYTIENGQFYVAEPGIFFIATPKDAHNPSNRIEGYEGVKRWWSK
jgi:biofilm protein TabA